MRFCCSVLGFVGVAWIGTCLAQFQVHPDPIVGTLAGELRSVLRVDPSTEDSCPSAPYSYNTQHWENDLSGSFVQTKKDTISSKVYLHGGAELRVWANGMSFFSRQFAGLSGELSHRWPGKTKQRDGHFSFGIQASYWPSLGCWSAVPFDIGRITAFRLDGPEGSGSVRFGSVVVLPNELFLVGREGTNIRLTGNFRINPVSSSIFEFITYRITGMRTSMVGANVPLRWYWGNQRTARPRFFTELGVGFDLLMVKAHYEVITRGINFDESTFTIRYNERTTTTDEPLDGNVGKNLLFSHYNVGGGVSYGKFSFFAQARFLFRSIIPSGRDKFRRVRGNILAIPVLAGAGSDPGTIDQLERDGAIRFGATGISKGDETSNTHNGDKLANGVSKFWNGTQWTIGVAFRIL